MPVPAIDIQNLTKIYKGELGEKDVLGLEDLSLQIPRGEIFAFIGPNGAGKSTTIKLLTRLIFPTKGKIRILGQDNQSVTSLARVGFLPEQPSLYGYLSGIEFLDLIGQLFRVPKTERRERIKNLVATVGIEKRAKHLIKSYSRGMTQRLALAQALMNDPELLILDEPMANLDPIGRKDFRDLILSLKEQGKTIFFSSHILADAEVIANRVGIVNQGKLINVGRLNDLLTAQNQIIELVFSHSDWKQGEDLLKTCSGIQLDDKYIVQLESEADIYKTIHKFEKTGAHLISCIPQKKSLEDLFVESVKE